VGRCPRRKAVGVGGTSAHLLRGDTVVHACGNPAAATGLRLHPGPRRGAGPVVPGSGGTASRCLGDRAEGQAPPESRGVLGWLPVRARRLTGRSVSCRTPLHEGPAEPVSTLRFRTGRMLPTGRSASIRTCSHAASNLPGPRVGLLVQTRPVRTEVAVRAVVGPAVEDLCECGSRAAACRQVLLQDEDEVYSQCYSVHGPTPATRSTVMWVMYPGGGLSIGGKRTSGPR
jgi:hypothetical protein